MSGPYTVRAVGGMFGGQTKGPYSTSELMELYKEYAPHVGGMFVKTVEVWVEDKGVQKLFFVFPRDGGLKEFVKKDTARVAKPKPKPKGPVIDAKSKPVPDRSIPPFVEPIPSVPPIVAPFPVAPIPPTVKKRPAESAMPPPDWGGFVPSQTSFSPVAIGGTILLLLFVLRGLASNK
jgi:hypothetical protein